MSGCVAPGSPKSASEAPAMKTGTGALLPKLVTGAVLIFAIVDLLLPDGWPRRKRKRKRCPGCGR